MMDEYVLKLLEKNERIDKRKLDEFRKIDVKTGIIERAEGSARVKMGKTDVIVGIKMGLGEPFPDTPNHGMLRVDAEFSPIAHSEFEAGPPRENATELARVVDRGIRESGAIDLEKLCIKEGERVWAIFVDIYMINHDGNLVDASSLGAMAALLNTKMLKLEKDEIARNKFSGKLPVKHKAVVVSVGKIGDKLLIDPTDEEERFLDCRLCVGVMEDGKICAMQKIGSKELTEKDLSDMIDLAVKKSKELMKLI